MRDSIKVLDRRTAVGKLKPFVHMFVEIVALLIMCWLVTIVDVLLLSTLTYFCVMFYIIITIIPRYKIAIKRQKLSPIEK